jgi:hypothetical protein
MEYLRGGQTATGLTGWRLNDVFPAPTWVYSIDPGQKWEQLAMTILNTYNREWH